MEASKDLHAKKLHAWTSVPAMVGRIFVSQTPTARVFLYSISMTSSLRALLLTCELLGAMALNTFFTHATGRSRSRTAPAKDDNKEACAMSGAWEMLGRLIIIGLCSAFVAQMPVSCLRRFHRREFMTMDYEGSDAWVSQLRRWRIRDRFLWACGILYSIFCAHFIALFCASVMPADQTQWIIGTFSVLMEELFLFPIITSLTITLVAMVALSAVALHLRTHKGAVLERRSCSRTFDASTNSLQDQEGGGLRKPEDYKLEANGMPDPEKTEDEVLELAWRKYLDAMLEEGERARPPLFF